MADCSLGPDGVRQHCEAANLLTVATCPCGSSNSSSSSAQRSAPVPSASAPRLSTRYLISLLSLSLSLANSRESSQIWAAISVDGNRGNMYRLTERERRDIRSLNNKLLFA